MAEKPKEIVFEGVQIIFKNFSGVEGKFNRAGDRNFAVIIDDKKLAQQFLKDGWNIKYLTPREESDEPVAYLGVTVSYKNYPPNIIMIAGKTRTRVDEKLVEVLDTVNMKNVDFIARPYVWDVDGKGGVKAYLQSMYVTIEEDYLERKYAAEYDEEGEG